MIKVIDIYASTDIYERKILATVTLEGDPEIVDCLEKINREHILVHYTVG